MKKRNYEKNELVKFTEREPELKNFNDKEILIHLNSFCLGDTICFFSFIKSFLEFHKPKKLYVTTFFPEIFELDSEYPNVELIKANTPELHLTVDKMIDVGYQKNNLFHTLGGMFYSAKDTMKLPQSMNPVRPPMKKISAEKIKDKITIAPESIKKIAVWDYFGNYGWQMVVDYLNENNFKVYNVSYEDTIKLNNVLNFNKEDDLEVATNHIVSSKLFIGLSSGLSWLAWAYNIPVVMISGFTKTHNEFECYRVSNEQGCSGCFNVFKNIKNRCPIFLNTERENECHKRISPEMVISKIKQALADQDEK
jgi:autotransporter strand-loop-strand O-heptosyltransferase